MKPFVDICHWRAQNNKAPFVVTYYEDGERKYKHFGLRFTAEQFYQRKLTEYKNIEK